MTDTEKQVLATMVTAASPLVPQGVDAVTACAKLVERGFLTPAVMLDEKEPGKFFFVAYEITGKGKAALVPEPSPERLPDNGRDQW